MRETIRNFCAVGALMLLGGTAQAASISLTPSSDVVLAGDIVTVTISADFTDQTILGGGFDVFYDDTVLDFLSFSFDAALPDDQAFRRDPDDLANELNGFAFGDFFGINGQFVIGQISFVAIANGVTPITLGINEGGLGPNPNGPGNPGPFVGQGGNVLADGDIQFGNTAVEVVVPIPAAIWMLLSGLGALGVLRKRQ